MKLAITYLLMPILQLALFGGNDKIYDNVVFDKDGVCKIERMPVEFIDIGKSDHVITFKEGKDSMSFNTAMAFRYQGDVYYMPVSQSADNTYKYKVVPNDTLFIDVVVFDTSNCHPCHSYKIQYDNDNVESGKCQKSMHVRRCFCSYISNVYTNKSQPEHVHLYDNLKFDSNGRCYKNNISVVFADFNMTSVATHDSVNRIKTFPILSFYYQDTFYIYELPISSSLDLSILEYLKEGDNLLIDIVVENNQNCYPQEFRPVDYCSSILGIKKTD